MSPWVTFPTGGNLVHLENIYSVYAVLKEKNSILLKYIYHGSDAIMHFGREQ